MSSVSYGPLLIASRGAMPSIPSATYASGGTEQLPMRPRFSLKAMFLLVVAYAIPGGVSVVLRSYFRANPGADTGDGIPIHGGLSVLHVLLGTCLVAVGAGIVLARRVQTTMLFALAYGWIWMLYLCSFHAIYRLSWDTLLPVLILTLFLSTFCFVLPFCLAGLVWTVSNRIKCGIDRKHNHDLSDDRKSR